MISKVTVTRISALLFLGGLVVLLLGLTIGPRFANAGGGQDCAALLVNGPDWQCGDFSLMFHSEESGFTVISEELEIGADCRCVGAANRWLCMDKESDVILHGRVVSNTSITQGRIIVPGEGSSGFSCSR
jgi:hypothetical protein